MMFNFWQEGMLPTRNELANKTLTWSGSDTEENFNRKNPTGYTPHSVVYKYNSYGFRTHEIDTDSNKDNIICLGCSHTEGIGIQEPWPVALESYFPTSDVHNLGMQGSSVDAATRILVNIVPLLKPKIVFILWPHFARFETYQSGGYIKTHGHWNMDRTSLDHYDELTCYNRFCQHEVVANLLAFKYNFQLVDYKVKDLDNWGHHKEIQIDRGRDGEHYGPKVHQHLAEVFYNKYQSEK